MNLHMQSSKILPAVFKQYLGVRALPSGEHDLLFTDDGSIEPSNCVMLVELLSPRPG